MPCEDRHTQGTGHMTSQEPPGTASNTEAAKRQGHDYSPQRPHFGHQASELLANTAVLF